MKWHLSIKLTDEDYVKNITCDYFTVEEHTGILVCYDFEGDTRVVTNAFNSSNWLSFVSKKW